MNPLTANLGGHINAVVDQKGHIVLLRDAMQLARRLDKVRPVQVLVSVLDDGDAALESLLHDPGEVSVAEDGGRGVCDEVDAVVDGHDVLSEWELLCDVTEGEGEGECVCI